MWIIVYDKLIENKHTNKIKQNLVKLLQPNQSYDHFSSEKTEFFDKFLH